MSIDLAGILDVLAGQELLLGLFLTGVGLVFIIVGFRVCRPLVTISFGIIGFIVAALLVEGVLPRLALGLASAAVLGAAGSYSMRISIPVLGALWAAALAWLTSGQFDIPLIAQIAIVAVAAVAAISLTAIMHREAAAFVLSFEGSLLCIGGLVALANQNPMLWSPIRQILVNNPICVPLLALAGTVTGFYWQMSEQRQHDAGTSG